MELYLLQLSSHEMGFLRHSCTRLNSTPRHNKQQLQKNTPLGNWEVILREPPLKPILNLEERCGKNEEGEGAQQGEVWVHSSPRNPVTLNSTFVRFVNRPRGKVLGADQRAELRGREEMLIQPKSAREFVGKWWGAEGLRWGPAGREGGEPPRPAPGRTRRQRAAGVAAPRARRPRPNRGARPAPGVSRGAGSRLPPHPALCPRAGGGRRASPRRPRRGLRGRADSPRPPPGRRARESARPATHRHSTGFVQAGRSRRRSEDAGPARGAAATARSARRPRSGGETLGLRNPHHVQHPSLTQKFSTKCAMTIVPLPTPRRVPRPRPPAAP